MIANRITLYAAQSRRDGFHLIDHIDTVALIGDHLMQAPYLAFYASQPRQLTSMVDRLMARLFRFGHDGLRITHRRAASMLLA